MTYNFILTPSPSILTTSFLHPTLSAPISTTIEDIVLFIMAKIRLLCPCWSPPFPALVSTIFNYTEIISSFKILAPFLCGCQASFRLEESKMLIYIVEVVHYSVKLYIIPAPPFQHNQPNGWEFKAVFVFSIFWRLFLFSNAHLALWNNEPFTSFKTM